MTKHAGHMDVDEAVISPRVYKRTILDRSQLKVCDTLYWNFSRSDCDSIYSETTSLARVSVRFFIIGSTCTTKTHTQSQTLFTPCLSSKDPIIFKRHNDGICPGFMTKTRGLGVNCSWSQSCKPASLLCCPTSPRHRFNQVNLHVLTLSDLRVPLALPRRSCTGQCGNMRPRSVVPLSAASRFPSTFTNPIPTARCIPCCSTVWPKFDANVQAAWVVFTLLTEIA